MVPGMPNTYSVTPLVKMVIAPVNTTLMLPNLLDAFSVLYNPQSYRMSRRTMPRGMEKNANTGQQFPVCATFETLDVDLFLDTFSAGPEVVGLDMMKSPVDALKFEGNSLLPSVGKQLDVRDYVEKIYDLCLPDDDTHAPPLLALIWNSLKFLCFMQGCSVEYTKFKETGMPVRATMHCSFISAETLFQMMGGNPLNSPDTSKFHTLKQGETLNTLSSIAYDDPTHWREIARANGITNPRLLRTGDVMHMPALVD